VSVTAVSLANKGNAGRYADNR